MKIDQEVHEFLLKHLQSIRDNNVETYHQTTSEDLTLYEWWVTPHRIDGLPFHDFLMSTNEQRGEVFGAEVEDSGGENVDTRFDLSNLKIQNFGETAIASYTLLISTSTDRGVTVVAHNESRVMVKIEGEWQVVHVHKSPAWPAPHTQPTDYHLERK